MIADMLSIRNLISVASGLFVRDRKPNVSLVFMRQSYFAISQKNIDKVLHTISLWKFQMNKNFNKLHSIIHQILISKIL